MARFKLVRKSFLRRFGEKYGNALLYFTGYCVWIGVFKLLCLTVVAYFVMGSKAHAAHLEDVNDSYGTAQISILALCALSFVVVQRLLDPLQKREKKAFFTPQRFEQRFVPGFLHGSVLASGVLLAFLLSGVYHYLGFFVHFDQAPLAISAIVIRIISIGILAYTEEYIFRDKILGSILRHSSVLGLESAELSQFHEFSAVAITSILYVAAKFLQFDSELGYMNGISLYLVSLYLGLRTLFERDFIPAAGFWAAVLIVFNPLMSLPIFGNDFGGLLLIKYQQVVSQAGGDLGYAAASAASETTRFFSGGVGGPLASFAFQILMMFDIARNALRYREI
jgi:hypothetical protein